MADRMLGLIGPGEGPMLHTAGMKNLQARIDNLEDGSVRLKIGDIEMLFDKPGVFDIPDSPWMCFCYKGESKELICTIHTRQ